MIRNYYSDKKIYLMIALINFIMIITWCLYKSGLLYVFFHFLFSSSYRSMFSYEMHNLTQNSSLLTVMRALINEYNWEFDYYLSESSVLFSLTLPVTSSIAGILLIRRLSSILFYAVYRAKSRQWFLFLEAIKSSFSIALCFFIPMLMQYIILYFMAKGNMYGSLGAHLLLDFFRSDFYFSHPYLYWFANTVIRFFFCPFCYGMLSCGICFIFSSFRDIIWFSNLYYYGLMMISSMLSTIAGNYSIYLNPYIFLADGGSFYYTDYNTAVMLITGAGIPFLIGCSLLLFKNETLYS